MSVPSIISKCLPLLRTLTNNNVDDIALINCLNAKLAYMASLKNVRFKQFNNAISKPLAYYAINFMPSGSSKDFTVDCINNYLLNFCEEYLDQYLDTFKTNYYNEQYVLKVASATGRAKDKAEQQLKEEMEQFRVVNTEIEEANLSGVYEEAKQIELLNCGAIFIRIPELGDYIDAANRSDKDKRNLMSKLKNIYEGTITPSIIAGNKKRRPVNNVAVQALMYTDFENLVSGQNNKFFKEMLKTGYARRCFVYMPKTEDNKIKYPVRRREVEERLLGAQSVRQELFGIFERLCGQELVFTEEAQDLIYEYKCRCIDEVNKMKHKKSIVATDLSESFWKIQKLSALYAVLEQPTTHLIGSNVLQMAIDFYKAIRPSLTYVMEKKEKTVVELMADFIVERPSRVVSKMELRHQHFVPEKDFTRWLKDNAEALREELDFMGYILQPYDNQISGFQAILKDNGEADTLIEL